MTSRPSSGSGPLDQVQAAWNSGSSSGATGTLSNGDAYCLYSPVVDDRGCRRLRTCQECSRLPGCMINHKGQCFSATGPFVNTSLDFQLAQRFAYALPALNLTTSFPINATTTRPSSTGVVVVGGSGNGGSNSGSSSSSSSTATVPTPQRRWQFPISSSMTYCPSQDPVCTYCRRELFPRSPEDARFCVGMNGCVCVARCEGLTLAKTIRRQQLCPRRPGKATRGSSASWHPPHRSLEWIVTGVAAIVACIFIYWWFCRQTPAPTSRHRSRQQKTGQHLGQSANDPPPDDEDRDGPSDATAFTRPPPSRTTAMAHGTR